MVLVVAVSAASWGPLVPQPTARTAAATALRQIRVTPARRMTTTGGCRDSVPGPHSAMGLGPYAVDCIPIRCICCIRSSDELPTGPRDDGGRINLSFGGHIEHRPAEAERFPAAGRDPVVEVIDALTVEMPRMTFSCLALREAASSRCRRARAMQLNEVAVEAPEFVSRQLWIPEALEHARSHVARHREHDGETRTSERLRPLDIAHAE
jgi:hypothetical protein